MLPPTPVFTVPRGPALERHLRDCERARGRWFGLRCAAETLDAMVAPRFCTTVFVAAGLIGLVAAIWV